jgi:hypothetical protein
LQPLLQRWQSQSEADRAVLMVLGHSIGLAPEASCGSRPQLGLDRPFYANNLSPTSQLFNRIDNRWSRFSRRIIATYQF